MAESVARELRLILKPCKLTLTAFNRTAVIPLGSAIVSVEIDGVMFRPNMLIVTDFELSCKILIGRDILISPGVKAVIDAKGVKLYQNSDDTSDSFYSQIGEIECLEVNMIDFCDKEAITDGDVRIGKISDRSKMRLVKLLNAYRDNVSKDKSDGVKEARVPGMKIDLLTNEPVCHSPYRLSFADREKVQAMVDRLKEVNIIRDSNSPYASPIVLTRKKTGEVRMCVDYRALNKITKKIKIPLPIIDDQIDRLVGKKIFISLDLKTGFHQIPMDPESVEKTAFVTPDGQFEYLRVPFGLCNSPAYFQNAMRLALKGLPVQIYIDDILIATEEEDEAFRILELVLEALKKYQFTLKLDKCRWFESTVEYLGREISADGVRPASHKIEAVKYAPHPRNVKQVRQFCGLASYFRKFIKDFARIAAPITKLLKKGVPWTWGPEQKEAIEKLKALLTSRPLLSIYDPILITEVHTDASSIGLGGMLLQINAGDRKVVAYWSRKTTAVEQFYHSFDLETLAVHDALKHFRVYLLGIKFKVITDCTAVRATASKKDIQPRVARWWMYLQDFDFEVVYRPGAQGAHVDYLSRNPVECMAVDITSSEWIKIAQLQDPEIEVLKKVLESGDVQSDNKHIFDNYDLKGGIVFRRTNDGNKWLVPRMARFNVVQLCHDQQGHFAVEKTLEKLREHYWFKSMRRFTAKYVNACLNCLYYKNNKGKKTGEMHPIDKVAIPFHTIHIDHVGPFVKSKRKNKQILTIIDGFTKFTVLEPVRTTKTRHVIKALNQLFAIFGTPSRIICDRGTAFTSNRMKEFCEEYNIKLVKNAVATPRANGQCERTNRTILASLAATSAGCPEDEWDLHVKKVQSAVNCSTNRVTRRTPIQLLCGYKPRSMADAALTAEIQAALDEEELTELRREAKLRIDKDQATQKERYDGKRSKTVKYQVGDVVMVPTAPKATGESNKLKAKFRGPFKIVTVLPKDRYEVEDQRQNCGTQGHKTVVAVDSLKKWVQFDAME